MVAPADIIERAHAAAAALSGGTKVVADVVDGYTVDTAEFRKYPIFAIYLSSLRSPPFSQPFPAFSPTFIPTPLPNFLKPFHTRCSNSFGVPHNVALPSVTLSFIAQSPLHFSYIFDHTFLLSSGLAYP